LRKANPTGIVILVLVGLVVLLSVTSFYRIKEGENAVVLTFGEVTDTKTTAGLYWHLPIIQAVKIQSTTEVYTFEFGFNTTRTGTTTTAAQYITDDAEAIMLTGDNSIVRVEATYQVTVADVEQFFFEVDDPFGTLQYAFETIIRRNVQNKILDVALTKKAEIETEVLADFKALAEDTYNLGITVKSVKIQNIVVPDEVSDAYRDVQNAINEQTTKLDEGERYENEVVPAAEAKAYKMIQDAEAYKAETIAQAQGEVAVFNAVYEKYILSPEITRKRLFIETIEKIMASADKKYIISEGSDVLEFLPLETTEGGGINE
jgi:membrane protease subunit HflK